MKYRNFYKILLYTSILLTHFLFFLLFTVNNVGKQYDYPMMLCEVPTSQAWEIINVNVGAVTTMTRMVLPGMVARGRGAVVNVSSGSELQPLPLMAIYAATKVSIYLQCN